ncbi:zinc finger CCCH domain-containing protein 7A isoform X1 [Acipenser ruthenus]|uniref:zinc finger CCCH domain-containing protein 7A isoform X1 n=2 Tax=Acipenser ruthenus TaxID=7906 RepID=UPI00274147E7|nr:zinc finger CCCH domain-containing protein 7A isoform X1 [Acipenser ruthenus]
MEAGVESVQDLDVQSNMSNVYKDRSSRWQDIQKGLQFIQSTLPYPGTEQEYEVFIQDLVRKLFGEGNDVYREGDWARSLGLYTEALNIADYAESEDISIASENMEKLYANRAACHLNMGAHDQVLEDCEKSLQHNENNYRALFRKSKSLKELGRHKEAYDAVAKCSLAVPHDENVIKLTRELAKKLGLKIRKAYVRAQPALNPLTGSCNSGAAIDKCSKGLGSVEDIEMDLSDSTQESGAFPVSAVTPCSSEAESARCESASLPASIPVSSVSPIESHAAEEIGHPNGASVPFPVPESRLDYDADIIGDDLDDLLDSEPPVSIPMMKDPIPLPTSVSQSMALPSSMLLPPRTVSNPFVPSVTLPSLYSLQLPVNSGLSSLDGFGSRLDSLDALSISETRTDLSSSVLGAGSQAHSGGLFVSSSTDSLPGSHSNRAVTMGQNGAFSNGVPAGLLSLHTTSLLNSNPLADTHEFMQACNLCYVKTGSKLLNYVFHAELEHQCKKDVLLGRIKHSEDLTWKRVRPRPIKSQYVGPYYICKDVAAGGECRYPGNCTFAYCQEEIDVWTLERNRAFSRELLFDPFGGKGKINLTVAKVLQEHHGIFMFLCEVCFDHKPRIISKRNQDSPYYCSHPVTKHDFEENKCLVHILRETTVKYSKIRPRHVLGQFDLCRHEVRYGCVREDECYYAHSLIELKVWMIQAETGITPEAITLESKKYWSSMEVNFQGAQQTHGMPARFGPPNVKIQFVCGQCWRNGQVSEPDKNKKYCTAKARHPWSKERRVVLVMSSERKKWTTIRPLPTKKPIPAQFDLCIHIASGKKCQYIGNCSFAHSPEERDMWTYMKDNSIQDMEQLYELWLKSQSAKPEQGEEAVRQNGNPIHMPTDYAEEMAGYHCWLCGKNCNSEKQWQQHITSEKHKDKLFNSEDDQNCWQYRFPTGCFRVCERYLKGSCTEEDGCKLAHGKAELKEWEDRREFLLMKLAKARNDHLIAPNDNDFGKYSFLLKDIH